MSANEVKVHSFIHYRESLDMEGRNVQEFLREEPKEENHWVVRKGNVDVLEYRGEFYVPARMAYRVSVVPKKALSPEAQNLLEGISEDEAAILAKSLKARFGAAIAT